MLYIDVMLFHITTQSIIDICWRAMIKKIDGIVKLDYEMHCIDLRRYRSNLGHPRVKEPKMIVYHFLAVPLSGNELSGHHSASSISSKIYPPIMQSPHLAEHPVSHSAVVEEIPPAGSAAAVSTNAVSVHPSSLVAA